MSAQLFEGNLQCMQYQHNLSCWPKQIQIYSGWNILSSLAGKYWFWHYQYSTHYRYVFPGIHWQQGWYWRIWSICHIIQYTPCALGSVQGNTSLGTVFPRTLPRENIGNTSSRENIYNAPAMMQSGSMLICCRQAICQSNGCEICSNPKRYKQSLIEIVLM